MLRSDAVAAVTPPAPPLPGREEGGAQAAVTWQGGGREEQPAGREQFGLHSWTGREEGRASVGQTLAGAGEGLVGVRGSKRE